MYDQAFCAAGGDQAMEKHLPLSRRFGELMKPMHELTVTQMEAWQCYDLNFMHDRLGEGSVRSFGAALLESTFKEMKEGGAKHKSPLVPDAVLEMGGVKKIDRAAIKTRIKYGSDCSRLCDLNRATIVCPEINGMYAVAERLFSLWGPDQKYYSATVVEFQDHYYYPMPGGYRHLQLLVLISGVVWELQLTTAPMIEAKHKAGHKLYKTTRFVKEMLLFTAMDGAYEALEKLLSFEGVREVANPNEVRDKNGLTALHHAAFRGDADTVNLLRDKTKVSESANPWCLDKTESGGLALNYAMHMRHWTVAELLIEAMLEEVPGHGHRPGLIEKVADACAAGVDAFAERPDLLPKLMMLWKAADTPEHERRSPMQYAFQHGQQPAQKVIIECLDADWIVDRDEKLPIELAIEYDFMGTARFLVARMFKTKPKMPSAEAVRSLAKCRGRIAGIDELAADFVKKEVRVVATGACLSQLNLFGLKRICEDEVPSSTRHTCLVMNEETLYAGCIDGSIEAWNLTARAREQTFEGHTQCMTALVLGSKRKWPDGTKRPRRLFSASADNEVRIWDLFRRLTTQTFKLVQDITALSIVESTLYASAERTIHRFNVLTRKRLADLRTTHTGIIDSLIVISKRLFSAGVGGAIHVGAHGSGVHSEEIWPGHTRGWRVTCMKKGPEDSLLSAANYCHSSSPFPPSSREWRGRHLQRHDGPSEILHWSREGDLLREWRDIPFCLVSIASVTGMVLGASSKGHIRIWDLKDGDDIQSTDIDSGELSSVVVGEVDDDSDCSEDERSSPVASASTRLGGTLYRSPVATPTRVTRTPRAAAREWTEQEKTAMKARFEELDCDLDGRITLKELAQLLASGGRAEVTPLVESLFDKMDKDRDGAVAKNEFIDYIFT
jgi:hypothetical protein